MKGRLLNIKPRSLAKEMSESVFHLDALKTKSSITSIPYQTQHVQLAVQMPSRRSQVSKFQPCSAWMCWHPLQARARQLQRPPQKQKGVVFREGQAERRRSSSLATALPRGAESEPRVSRGVSFRHPQCTAWCASLHVMCSNISAS